MAKMDSLLAEFELLERNGTEKIGDNLDNNLQIEFNELKNKYILLEEKHKNFEDKINIKVTSLEEKFGELTEKLEKVNKVCFVNFGNKWKQIEFKFSHFCCENKCINTDKPIGVCINGNGFVNLINWEKIKYIKGNKVNKPGLVYAENSFKIPKEYCVNYSLFYFEIKCKIEGEENLMHIGLLNCENDCVRYFAEEPKIINDLNEKFKLSTFSWNDGDIFGIGVVYPPTTRMNELPFVFFTQNGKQIGKAVLLKENYDYLIPYVVLKNCSVEANFGDNLETKPFCYEISKNFVFKEFY
uniref:Uncharacterized protein n=1 Tax=Meloidogyne enterolobii TaxID=390850 RepID=A0A6V7U188_MELEN|nr:unnamed protein product [Meloidogyne enterolobii]